MTVTTVHGVDVSSYQKGWKPGPNDAFVIIKASEGLNYRNPDGLDQRAQADKDKLVIGWYHMLSPHLDAVKQAQYFVATNGIKDGDFLVCDWEKSGSTNDDKDIFLAEVKKLKPHCKVGLYCNVYWWLHIELTNNCGDFLWIADYNATVPIKHPYLFWQYSGTGIDQDRAYFTSEAVLRDWARNLIPQPNPTPNPKPTPAPAPNPKPSYGIYHVKAGDTLTSIAHKYHTSVHHLVVVNNLKDPDKIFPGQVLKVPR